MSIETTQTLIYTLVAVIAFFGLAGIAVIGWYRFKCVIDIVGEQLAFDEKDELTQSKTKGAYWCEGCYSWQLPTGHDEHIESCDCPY